MATANQTGPQDEPPSTDDLAPGDTIGPYTILAPIGRGGMAHVWAARISGGRGFTKTVALKTILPEYSKDKEYSRMFLDEARIAAAIHHPNVCEVYELGTDRDILFMAMEWVAGDAMSELMRVDGARAPIPLPIAVRLVADACAGLHAVHEAADRNGVPLNVVHRDISPHNILVSDSGHAKVADFGVAKARDQLHERTKTGQLKGKIAYIAPEQLLRKGLDRRADIFSMGCVLYQATLGTRPFGKENDFETLRSIVRGEYSLPRNVDSDYPEALQDIVVCALQVSAKRRYETAQAMRVALESWLAQLGTVVTQGHVGDLVKERLGAAIARRRREIRQASQAITGPTSTARMPAASPSGLHAAVDPPPSETLAVDPAPVSRASIPSSGANGSPTRVEGLARRAEAVVEKVALEKAVVAMPAKTEAAPVLMRIVWMLVVGIALLLAFWLGFAAPWTR